MPNFGFKSWSHELICYICAEITCWAIQHMFFGIEWWWLLHILACLALFTCTVRMLLLWDLSAAFNCIFSWITNAFLSDFSAGFHALSAAFWHSLMVAATVGFLRFCFASLQQNFQLVITVFSSIFSWFLLVFLGLLFLAVDVCWGFCFGWICSRCSLGCLCSCCFSASFLPLNWFMFSAGHLRISSCILS